MLLLLFVSEEKGEKSLQLRPGTPSLDTQVIKEMIMVLSTELTAEWPSRPQSDGTAASCDPHEGKAAGKAKMRAKVEMINSDFSLQVRLSQNLASIKYLRALALHSLFISLSSLQTIDYDFSLYSCYFNKGYGGSTFSLKNCCSPDLYISCFCHDGA